MKTKNIHSTQSFEKLAKSKLPKFIFDFINGGAGDESTLNSNVLDLKKIRLKPNIPKDSKEFSSHKTLFDKTYNAPFGIAPIGLASAVYPNAELILAECAKQHNIPFILSAASNVTINQVLKSAGTPPWFQLYIPKETQIMERLINSAKDNQCPVLVITVDTAVPGIRLRDLKNNLSLPFKPSISDSINMLRHPHWLFKQLTHKRISFPNFEGLPGLEKGSNFSDVMAQQVGGNMSWETIKKIRKIWPRKLILKGIQSQYDAQKAQECGIDAVIISNHGGRQLDKVPSSISVLKQIDRNLFNKDYLMFDSGIRSGGDIVSSLACGADFVFVGRPFIYALALGGEIFVNHLIEKMKTEMINTFQLLGCTNINEINANHHLFDEV